MLRKEQRCRAEEGYARRFPKAVQMAHYFPRQPHALLSLHSGEELDSVIAGGRVGPLSTFSSQNPIHPTSVPSNSSVALQIWTAVLGCLAGCDNGSTQSLFLGASTGAPVAAAVATGPVSPSLPVWLSHYTDLTSKLCFVSTGNEGVAVFWTSSVLSQTNSPTPQNSKHKCKPS